MNLVAVSAITVERIAPSDVSLVSGARIAFWLIGALVVIGAIMTITRKNAVASVMSLVATFFGLAATYALLSAHFLAVLQVLVYAGAIMVLFIFVVMVLNRDEVEPWAFTAPLTKISGVLAIVYLIGFKLGVLLWAQTDLHTEAPPVEFGTVAQVGRVLFTDDLFAFEAVSVLLLIAVIGAVVLARSHGDAHPDESLVGGSTRITTGPL